MDLTNLPSIAQSPWDKVRRREKPHMHMAPHVHVFVLFFSLTGGGRGGGLRGREREEHKERKNPHMHMGGGGGREKERNTKREKTHTCTWVGGGGGLRGREGEEHWVCLLLDLHHKCRRMCFFPSFLTGLSGNPVILQRKEQIIFVKEVVSFLSFHIPVKNFVIKSGREPPLPLPPH